MRVFDCVQSGTTAGSGVGEIKEPLSIIRINDSNKSGKGAPGVKAVSRLFISSHCDTVIRHIIMQDLARRQQSASLSSGGSLSTTDEESDSEDDVSGGGQIEFNVNVAVGVNRQWYARVLELAKGNKALVIDLDKCDWQNGSKQA